MTSTFGEKLNVVSTHWSKHIEEIRPDVNKSACDALSFLEIWDFSGHDTESNTCYLAKMNTEMPIETTSESQIRILANLNELVTFRDDTFRIKESNLQGSFVYQSFGNTKNTQHCGIHCYFDPDDKCDYHYMYGSTCYLGSFTETNIGGPNHHTSVYIYQSNHLTFG